MPNTRAAERKARPAEKTRSTAASRRGRPPKKVFINVEIKSTTRDGLNALKRRSGLKNQGEVLDLLITERLGQTARKTRAR
jgi:hypothetical protein